IFSQPKIREIDKALIFEQDIRGLNVTVENTVVMSKLQRRCNLCEYAACFFLGKWSFSQALTQCAAFHIGHDTVVPGTMYSIFYDGQNMLVRQGSEGFYFALKAQEVIIFA